MFGKKNKTFNLVWDKGKAGCLIETNISKDAMLDYLREYREISSSKYDVFNFLVFLLNTKNVDFHLIVCYDSESAVNVYGIDHILFLHEDEEVI